MGGRGRPFTFVDGNRPSLRAAAKAGARQWLQALLKRNNAILIFVRHLRVKR